MLSRMAADVRSALSFIWRHTPTKSSMYESTHPCRGSWTDTSTGRAGANGVSGGYSLGGGMVDGSGIGDCSSDGNQSGLFIISIDKSVINLIIMHHSAGLKAAPKVRRR